MNLPTPTTTAEIYLAAIHEQNAKILDLAMRPVDLESIINHASGKIVELIANRQEPIPTHTVELKEPKRKTK